MKPTPKQSLAMTTKQAVLYRMVTDDHLCPFGLKSKHLLERKGYSVDDRHLTDREQTDAFKKTHDVETTPQTFIGGQRVGGYDDLKRYFGAASAPDDNTEQTSYQPVIAVFGVCALMALATAWATAGTVATMRVPEWFIALSMCTLAILKLRDLESFSNQFLSYDLLARKDVRYAYFYPFAEMAAGVLMLAGGAFIWIAAPLALFIGTIGAVSVVKAVYIDKRDIRCACVGGNSNVPLGAISLTENLMMIVMALYMPLRLTLISG